jgi:hypothetical protein
MRAADQAEWFVLCMVGHAGPPALAGRIKTRLLAQLMCRVKSRSSRSVNLLRGNSGPVWQRGYHDRALRRDEDLKAAAATLS